MNATIITYLIYLTLSIALTVWVARTLHRNGRLFLVDCFHGNDALADSVNHLLVVGFYLLNFGFVSYYLRLGVTVANAAEVFEILSVKMGVVSLLLGAVHFVNIYLFHRLRRNALLDREVRPPATPEFIKNLPEAAN
jgi:hypothetical protein